MEDIQHEYLYRKYGETDLEYRNRITGVAKMTNKVRIANYEELDYISGHDLRNKIKQMGLEYGAIMEDADFLLVIPEVERCTTTQWEIRDATALGVDIAYGLTDLESKTDNHIEIALEL